MYVCTCKIFKHRFDTFLVFFLKKQGKDFDSDEELPADTNTGADESGPVMFDDDDCEPGDAGTGECLHNGTDEDGFRDFIPAELKHHVGKNVFAVAKKAYSSLDVRHYFFTNENPKSVHPTRKGINLGEYEFEKLKRFLPQLEETWQGLRELPECNTTHKTPLSQARCVHCMPMPKSNNLQNKAGPPVSFENDDTLLEDAEGYVPEQFTSILPVATSSPPPLSTPAKRPRLSDVTPARPLKRPRASPAA